jgi:hypothetical protein
LIKHTFYGTLYSRVHIFDLLNKMDNAKAEMDAIFKSTVRYINKWRFFKAVLGVLPPDFPKVRSVFMFENCILRSGPRVNAHVNEYIGNLYVEFTYP